MDFATSTRAAENRTRLKTSTRAAENRTRLKGIVAKSSVVPRRPSKVIG